MSERRQIGPTSYAEREVYFVEFCILRNYVISCISYLRAAIRYFMSHANVHGENMLYILLVSHLKSIYDFRRTISSSISLIQFCPSVNKIKKREIHSVFQKIKSQRHSDRRIVSFCLQHYKINIMKLTYYDVCILRKATSSWAAPLMEENTIGENRMYSY